MFAKSEFQKASDALGKAESEVKRQEARLREMDVGIEAAFAAKDSAEQRASELISTERTFEELTAALDANAEERAKLDDRIENYQRLRAHQITNLTRAKIAVVEAERSVLAAQREHYEEALAKQMDRFVTSVQTQVVGLAALASAVAYHRELPRGEMQARTAWVGCDVIGMIGEALTRACEAQMARLSLDEPPKNSPPILAVKSTAVGLNERAVAEDLLRHGSLGVSEFTANLSRLEAPPPGNYDNRYQQGEMIAYWTDRVATIERSIVYAKIRERPATMAMSSRTALFDWTPIIEREIAELTPKLEHAQACLQNWQNMNLSSQKKVA